MNFKLKHILKTTAALLALIMLIETAPLDSLATAQNSFAQLQELIADNPDRFVAGTSEPPTSDTTEDVHIISEIESLRTEDTATYLNSDGSYTIGQYAEPVFYKDSDGKYKEIDNTLVSTIKDGEEVFENKENPFNVSLSKELGNSELVAISSGEYSLKWGIEGETPVKTQEFLEPEAEVLVEDKSLTQPETSDDEQKMAREKADSALTYKDMLPGVDLNYNISSTSLKENIIVNQIQDEYVYKFPITVENLTAEKLEDGSIRFFDPTNPKKGIYRIPAPYMFDATGSFSTDVVFDLSQTPDGYVLLLTADSEWVNSAERVLPVIIDPEVKSDQIEANNIETGVVRAGPNVHNQTVSAYGTAYVGRGYANDMGKLRSYIRIVTLPTIPVDNVITNAKFSLYQWSRSASTPPTLAFDSGASATTLNVYAHEVTGAWNKNSITWDNQPAFTSTVADYNTATYAGGEYLNYDVTKIAKKWYNGTNGNYGIMLKSYNEDEYTYAGFDSGYATGSGATTAKRPLITITYRNSMGIEDYWSYLDYELLGAGTAHLNYYTGDLTFETQDLAGTGSRIPFSMSHIYNGYLAGSNSSDRLPYSGLGWRLSAQKQLFVIAYSTEADSLYQQDYRYRYVDEDGTEHYFKTDLQDEDGLGLTITINTKDHAHQIGNYTLTDRSGNKSEFSNSNAGRCLLWFEKDTNGNYIQYNYDGITLKNVHDGADREYTLTYTSANYLTGVTEPSGRVTSYSYLGTKLNTITRPDNTTVTFAYDSSNRLQKVTNADGQYVQFDYNSRGQIIKVTEGGGTSAGQYIQLDYSQVNTTKVTENGNTANPITYKFDNSGRLVCVYDKEGNAEASSYSDAKRSKNKLTSNGLSDRAIVNLLKDPSAENGDGWSAGGVSAGQTTATVNTSLTNTYLGNKSLQLTSNNYDIQSVRFVQSVDIPAGMTANDSLTLSAYVKTNITATHPNPSSLGSHQSGATLYAIQQNAAGTANEPDIFSKVYITDAGGDWRRISFTFKPYNLTKSLQIRVGLTYAVGTAWFDCLQLEKSDTLHEYNLVENSSFEKVTSGVPDRWTRSSTSDTTDTSQSKDGTTSFKITGDAKLSKNIYQTIWIGEGSENDTYVISGWVKATAVPGGTTAGRYFALDVGIDYLNQPDKTQWKVVNFNTDIVGDWQYVSGVIDCSDGNDATNYKVKDLRVYFLYYNNLNIAYFDHMQVTEKSGSTTKYTVNDSNNQLTETTVESGSKTTDVYDANDNLISSTDASGATTGYQYNSLNQLIKITHPDSSTTNYGYDSAGNVNSTVEKNAAGTVTSSISTSETKTVDSVTKIITRTSSRTENGVTTSTSTTHTPDDNYQLSYTNEDGITTYTNYDNITDYTNNVVTRGNLTSETDAAGKTLTFTYDLLDRQLSVSTERDGQTVTESSAYSPAGAQTSLTRNGFTYNFGYDVYGNIASTGVGGYNLITNTYAPNDGDHVSSTYGNGQGVVRSYDSKGNLTNEKWDGSSTPTFAYTYDSQGNVISKVDNANGVTYTRDVRYDGNTLIVSGTDNTIFSYEKDNNGKLRKASYKVGTTQKTVNHNYDANGNYSQSALSGVFSTTNQFGSNGITSSVVTTANNTALTTSYGYDASGNPNGITNSVDGTWVYTYYPNGNIHTVSLDGVLKLSYDYDVLGQLKRENNAFADKTYVYEYDSGGNIEFKKTYAYTTDDVGTVLSTDSYVYNDPNWKDLLKTYNGSTITYDSVGNPLTYNGWTFTWQRGRQLATASNGTNSLSYQYNDEDVRTKKTVNGVLTQYYLDGGNVIQEQTGAETIWYYYDANEQLIGFELNGTPYYYMYNKTGDITAIVDVSGNVVAKYVYDAWGKILSMTDGSGMDISANTTAVGYKNPYRYKGYRYDNETKLYYLQSRYYNPELCRFINEDELIDTGEAFIGSNMFAYCYNDPVNNVDREGNTALPLWCERINAGRGLKIDYKDALNYDTKTKGLTKNVFMWTSCQQTKLKKAIDKAKAWDANRIITERLAKINVVNLQSIGWKKITFAMTQNLITCLSLYGITSVENIRHFLSQSRVEIGDKMEFIEPESAGARYEGSKDLGNTKSGDGTKFRGAGWMHLTGRDNYQKFANYMGNKNIMNGSEYVAKTYPTISAVWFWGKLLRVADRDCTIKYAIDHPKNLSVEQVTRWVNGGQNNLKERKDAYNKVKKFIY
jgi:RHS repeat-associated protein